MKSIFLHLVRGMKSILSSTDFEQGEFLSAEVTNRNSRDILGTDLGHSFG